MIGFILRHDATRGSKKEERGGGGILFHCQSFIFFAWFQQISIVSLFSSCVRDCSGAKTSITNSCLIRLPTFWNSCGAILLVPKIYLFNQWIFNWSYPTFNEESFRRLAVQPPELEFRMYYGRSPWFLPLILKVSRWSLLQWFLISKVFLFSDCSPFGK